LAIDGLNNWSLEDEELYLVDWTEPIVSNLSDGSSSDIDTTYLSTLTANWMASDPNSGVSAYQIAVGTTPGDFDVQPWTSNGALTTLSHVLSNPVIDQVYYTSVRSTNGAGLMSEMSSDGQRYVEEPGAAMLKELFNKIQVYPNPASTALTISSVSITINVQLFSSEGKLVFQENTESALIIDITQFSAGMYNLVLSRDAGFIVKKVVIQH
jgi:hypothetical protein